MTDSNNELYKLMNNGMAGWRSNITITIRSMRTVSVTVRYIHNIVPNNVSTYIYVS